LLEIYDSTDLGLLRQVYSSICNRDWGMGSVVESWDEVNERNLATGVPLPPYWFANDSRERKLGDRVKNH
jgi:hypothetical protein